MTLADADGTIEALPAFSDNYIWLIRRGRQVAVVDPGEAGPVLRVLAEKNLVLRAILLTHHHNDHVGGVLDLLREHPVPVYGPAGERLPHCDVALKEGDRIAIPELDMDLATLDVPGHTAGHIAFFGRAAGIEPVLFSGDTLFAAGCGRLLEGTATQMLDSLDKFSVLPDETQVFCGHEYTLANLRWAQAVDPADPALRKAFEQTEALRTRNRPSLPSTIGVERAINPFLRARHSRLVQAASKQAGHALTSPVEVFAALREWKNNFK
jgi:hydroxyacylglutathione hydrolase